MESTQMTEKPQVNLFAEKLPSLKQIDQLCRFINSSEANIINFADELKQKALTSESKSPAIGIGYYIIGMYHEALDSLNKAAKSLEKHLYLALTCKKLKEYDLANEHIDKALKDGADQLMINLEKAEIYRLKGDFDTTKKLLDSCANYAGVSADFHYQLARLDESLGQYSKAVSNYKKAIEIDPNNQKALFHLAYRCDMAGDELAAIDYYKQITLNSPVYVSALINLAVLYEDAGKFSKAATYIDMILMAHPNHQRALMFSKDIESSKTMFYDEEKEKNKTRKNKMLETPISDFELSVRSRNCLRKMNIRTVGDLLNISETELLSYKNFGETSLREIKAILESKSLRLGLALEDGQDADNENDPLAETEVTEYDQAILTKPVEDLQLSVRSHKCVEKLNLQTIGQLVQKTEAELLGCKNFGVTSLNEIKKALAGLGISLRTLE